jgi:hypothetical protein
MRHIRNEKGIALFVSLMILIMLTLIGMAAILTTNTEVNIAANEKSGAQALYLAEAGVSVVKAFFENPDSFAPTGGATGGAIQCLGADGSVQAANCTAANHAVGPCTDTWLDCFFDERRTNPPPTSAPDHRGTGWVSQYLDINNDGNRDSNNRNDTGSADTDANTLVNDDRPALKIVSQAYINDTLLAGAFNEIGRIEMIELYPPLMNPPACSPDNPQPCQPNFAVVRVKACVPNCTAEGHAERVVEQEIGPGSEIAILNGLSIQGVAGWNGNGSVHWGPVVTAGNVDTGQLNIHCIRASVCGGPDDITSAHGQADKWWSLDATGSIKIGNTTLPDAAYDIDPTEVDGDPADWNMKPGSSKQAQTFTSEQKAELKKYSLDSGQYYVYCSTDSLLHPADNSGNPTGAGKSFEELTNGETFDMLYVDMGALNTPSCNPGAVPPPTPTFNISGSYYTNSNIFLEGTFSIGGLGATTNITAQDPDQVQNEQPGTHTLGVHINGLIYTTGDFESSGNPVIYGAVIAEGGFTGAGNPDIWYNKSFEDGLPFLNKTSKQNWREIR